MLDGTGRYTRGRRFKAAYEWFEDRTGMGAAFLPLVRHPVPRDTGWAYVFGSATLVSFIVLVTTGIALATGYTPTTNDAYHSLQWISPRRRAGPASCAASTISPPRRW